MQARITIFGAELKIRHSKCCAKDQIWLFITTRVKDKKKDKEDEDPEKKEKKRNRFLSLRLFKSSKDKDKDDDDSPPSSEKQITPPTKSTEPSPRKMGPAGGEFNLEALKRVGDLLNSQPGGDSTCRGHTFDVTIHPS